MPASSGVRVEGFGSRKAGMGCGCLLVLVAWISPRFVMTFLWIFTDRLSNAFDSFVVGLAGFVLMPYTSVLYALTYSPTDGVSGLGWLVVGLGALLDLGSWLGSGREARARSQRRVIVVRDDRL